MDTSFLHLSVASVTLLELFFVNVIPANCLELRGMKHFPHSGHIEIEDR
jgi:hypothetical protein